MHCPSADLHCTHLMPVGKAHVLVMLLLSVSLSSTESI